MFLKLLILLFYLVLVCGSYLPLRYLEKIKLNKLNDDKPFGLDTNFGYEIVLLPAILPRKQAISENGNQIEEILMEFEAFGRPLKIKLKENNNLISPNFKSYLHDGSNSTRLPLLDKSCLFLHSKDNLLASIYYCEPKFITGFIFLDDATLEITPISKESHENFIESDTTEKIPHLVRKHSRFNNNNIKTSAFTNKIIDSFTLEVSIFFDEFAYNIFAPYLSYDDEKIRDMLLAYLNGVQALYHHPTLRGSVEIVIVRLDILKSQPENLPVFNGESGTLLDSFCLYQKNLNVEDDSDPDHWDMALYVSGLDFFTYDSKGYKDYGTMGLSTVGGVCYEKFSCVIAEFGSTDVFGKPYPTAGFSSVYVLAHEIGHNLGMHHDGTKNNCPENGFIMSASRGTAGETHWSTCSAAVIKKLKKKKCLQDDGLTSFDHSKFFEAPGRLYPAKKQCEIFLSDKDAYAIDEQEDVCQSLKCSMLGTTKIFSSGPPLDGTQCDLNKHCYAGECIKSTDNNPSTRVNHWDISQNVKECQSGCIVKSMGYQVKKTCNHHNSINLRKSCNRTTVTLGLCKDTEICSNKIPVIDYASQRCKYFSRILTEVDNKGIGLQTAYDPDQPRLACTIFCRNKDSTYNIPKIQLNRMESYPYFPDGTWCHRENSIDFYCINHLCLPEDNKFFETINLENQNKLRQLDIYDKKEKFVDLDLNKDLIRKYSPDEEWLVDYILLPN